MTLDAIFGAANLLALSGWVALLGSPWFPKLADRVSGLLVPALLATAYVGILLAFWGRAEGGFGSLSEVMTLFRQPAIALAGWLHYLAFDLLVGAALVRDARENDLPFVQLLPCLPLTFLFGPAGFLAYVAVRAIRAALGQGRRGVAPPVAAR